jgi:hypothetical protein
VRSLVTLVEGSTYDLEELLRRISESKENLVRTGLFASVLLNDRTDEQNRLILTVVVKERGYLHAAPRGYVNLHGGETESESGFTLSYDNLFGNGGRLDLDFPVYDAAGIGVRARTRPGGFSVGMSALYAYSFTEDRNRFVVAPFVSTKAGKGCTLGFEAKLNGDDITCAAFTPTLEYGSRDRPSEKSRRWFHLGVSPYAGVNFSGGSDPPAADPGGTALYGFDAGVRFYRDWLLKIVSANSLEASAQGGTVPENLRLDSPVRGNRYRTLEAGVVVSAANELRVPWPWNNDIVIVPFLDAAVMGERSFTVYAGGGIGLRWHKGFLDPLSIDLAFGRGVTVNFEKRL